MNLQRFTPHSRSCIDPDCAGKCAVLRPNEEGAVVLHPVASPAPSGITTVGRDLIQQLLETGSIDDVCCIWEDTTPSYTIQVRDNYKPGSAADLVKLLARLRVTGRLVTSDEMDNDLFLCRGRRIF